MAQSAHSAPTQFSASIRAKLEWTDEDGSEHALFLRSNDTVQIGRDRGNEVSLVDDPGVSRNHAILTWRDDHFEITDLGSTNGTFVNEESAADPRPLQYGDIIRAHQSQLKFAAVSLAETAGDPAQSRRPGSKEPTFVVLPTAPQPRLIVSAGNDEGRRINLTAEKITLGRATAKDSWDVSLQDRAISRPHARITRKDEGYLLADLGSANGTRVNGNFVDEPVILEDGAVIVLGETTLLFRDK